MKNYAAIFLTVFFSLTSLAALSSGQDATDKYFENEVKQAKPAAVETRAAESENLLPPANDNFANAQTIALGANGTLLLTTSNVGGTKEANEPNHADNKGGNSVWFKFTPTVTRAVEIRTVSGETTFDTTLAVYRGNSVDSLTPVGANDDCFRQECNLRSRVRLLLTAGVTYRIAVDGYSNGDAYSSGTFKLIMEETAAAFEFNSIGLAYDLGTGVAGTIGMTNYMATGEANEPPHYSSPPATNSVWFRYKSNYNRSMTFELTDENLAGEIAVYWSPAQFPTFADLDKIDTNADHLANSRDKYAVTFRASTSGYYFIAVDYNSNNATENATGNFQLKFYRSRIPYSMKVDYFVPQTSMSVFRPSTGTWYNRPNAQTQNSSQVKFGQSNDVPVPSDYDGDGVTDYAVTRTENGKKVWYILNESFNQSFLKFQWGLPTDEEIVGDFNGDGLADQTVARVVGGKLTWYVAESPSAQLKTYTFGVSGDKPVIGDFDNDGYTDIAVTRNENGQMNWYILRSSFYAYNQMSVASFGLPTDIRTPEDFDGDGKTDIAVFRPSDGTWYIHRSSTGEVQATPFGSAGDKPQPADYDNDGKADLAVFRPSEGKWYFWFSATDTQSVQSWGLGTDVPVSSLTSLTQ